MNKKKTKNISKIIVAFTIVLAMVLTYFSPLVNVVAESYGNGDNFITLTLHKNDFDIDVVKINNITWSEIQTDEYHSNSNVFTIELFVYKKGDTYPNISYCGGTCGNHYSVTVAPAVGDSLFKFTVTVTDPDQTNVDLSIVAGPPIGVDSSEEGFDGKAYVVWSCGNGTCYHYFDAIPGFDDGMSTFYKDTDVKADNDNSISFNIKARDIGWILKSDFERWENAYKTKYEVESINWATLDPLSILGAPNQNMGSWENAAVEADACERPPHDAHWTETKAFQVCVDNYMFNEAGILPSVMLQPLNEPSYNNAYVSYGDRNFKIVIYNSDYKGITRGPVTTLLEELNYYPGEWANPFTMRDQFDISGTTKENPTAVSAILLDDTVVFETLDYNGFSIQELVALDVPEDAVSIDKDGNKFTLVFSSNFYDNVVFEAIDTNGGKSYFVINRYTVDGYFRMHNDKPVITAEFYFDRLKSYEDFDLTLKIIYKNGTIKNVNMAALFGVDDGLNNVEYAYEIDTENPEFGPAGKGLKKSIFEYELEDGEIDTIKDMYINVEYKKTDEDPTHYAGTYVGSGEGVLVQVYRGE